MFSVSLIQAYHYRIWYFLEMGGVKRTGGLHVSKERVISRMSDEKGNGADTPFHNMATFRYFCP